MRMFTKIGITAASGALPVLLWAGAAGAQQSQSQSQSQQSTPSSASTISGIGGTGGSGTLARTGTSDLMPLALGGVALGGAIVVRRGLRRRSPA